MKYVCKKCHGELSWWFNFRDVAMKENILYAALTSLSDGIIHMFKGNSGQRYDADIYSTTLYYCKNCKTYYMPCPRCNNLMTLKYMPVDGQTMVTCTCCGTKTLYAGDYEMGGG